MSPPRKPLHKRVKRKHLIFGLPAAVVIALAIALPLILIGGGAALVSMQMRDIWQPGLQLEVGTQANGRPAVRPGPAEEIRRLFPAIRKLVHHKDRQLAALISNTYQWQRCDPKLDCTSSGSGWVDISGATASIYTLVNADTGKLIRVKVNATASPAYGTIVNLGTSLPARMPESSGGHTLVVSPSGSGTTCSVGSPCSFSTAFVNQAVSGDIIQLRGGTNYTGLFTFGSTTTGGPSYSSTNPVTITTYPGDVRAKFTGDTTCQSSPRHVWTMNGVQGVRVRNVEFASPCNEDVKLLSPQHFEFDGVYWHAMGNGEPCSGSYSTASYPNGPPCGWALGLTENGSAALGPGRDLQIWNSICTNQAEDTWYQQGSIKHGHCLYWGGANGNTAVTGVIGFTIANSLFFDNANGNTLELGDAAQSGIVTNNTIDNTDTRSVHANGSLCTDFSGSALIFFTIGSGSTGTRTKNIRVTNNIISNNCGPGVRQGSTEITGVVATNNLGFRNAYGNDWSDSANGGGKEYSCASTATCTGNLPDADPLYICKTTAPLCPVAGGQGASGWGSTAKNYRLQPGSPARGQSDPAYTPPIDLDGNFRPAQPAVGAFG